MKRLTAILLMIMMLVLPTAVSAEGSAGLSFSGDTSSHVGEVFAVVVTFSAEENIAALQAEFSYDADAVKFLSGGNSVQAEGGIGSISGSGGAQSLSYSLEFRAIQAGETEIEIKNAEVISDETGRMLGSPAGSVRITVTEKAEEPAEDPEPQETPEAEEEQTELPEETDEEPAEADVIVIEDKKYIPTDAEIAGYMLLGDENGKLWLYRTSDGELMEYAELSANTLYQSAGHLSSLSLEDTVTIDGVECKARTAEEDGYYYVYLTDSTGHAAWYGYEESTGLLRKAEVTEETEEIIVENSDTALLDILTLVLAGLIVIALIGLILVLRRKRR